MSVGRHNTLLRRRRRRRRSKVCPGANAVNDKEKEEEECLQVRAP